MFEFIINFERANQVENEKTSMIDASNLDKPFEQRVVEMEEWHKREVSRLKERHLRRVAEMEKRVGNGEMDPALRNMMEHQRFMNEHEDAHRVHLLNALNF